MEKWFTTAMIQDLPKQTILYMAARLLKSFFLRNRALPGRHMIEIYYEESMSFPLSEIASRHGTDKGGTSINSTNIHAYTDFYFLLLCGRRFEPLSILECGIGSTDSTIPSNMGTNGRVGASLRMWKEFFPKAEIIGLDVDPKTMFSEPRIRTFITNQLEPVELRILLRNLKRKYDLIIDDGLHSFESIKNMLLISFDFLGENGVYVAEDLDLELISELSKILGSNERYKHHYFINFRDKNYRDQGGWLLVIHKY